MTATPVWERALNRYADRIYRLALLRDPRPKLAARATIAAFQAIDWTTAELDDRLEGRLVAALPRMRRWARRATQPELPPQFWRLPPSTRLALGLRLARS